MGRCPGCPGQWCRRLPPLTVSVELISATNTVNAVNGNRPRRDDREMYSDLPHSDSSVYGAKYVAMDVNEGDEEEGG